MTTTVQAPPVAVTLDGISRTYKSRAGDVHALRGVTHTFLRGTFTAVMGPSGSGKSTLLQVAAGLDRPTQGEVVVGEVPLGRLKETELTKLRRTSMAFVFQAYNLLDALTAYENVALPARLAGLPVDRAAVMDALREVGLEEKAKRRPPELSGGQQQRVAIARALHLRPEVLFADEPTGALDRASGRRVLELLREASDTRGQTVVMVTHDPLAASYAHTTLFLEDGQVVGRLDRADAATIAATMSELEPMMLKLSRQTVRHTWPPYVGALVALAFGVALLTVAITTGFAVDTTHHRPGLSAADRTQLADLASLFGIMSGVAMFMAIFVVGSTFGFVVATRRRQLGLLRLVGATPRQVRRLVLGESAIVAVVAAAAGCLLGTLATPVFLALVKSQGVFSVDLTMPEPWLPWSIAAPSGIVVALLGAWRSSKRAARVSPLAVFQEAGIERRRPSVWQLVTGFVCLGGAGATLVLAHGLNPVFSLVTGILLPEVVVIGLYCLGGWIFPALAGLVGGPFARRDVSARLARDHVRTAVRTPVALAAPILAISAVAGSMILALSFAADWATALDREQLATPYVVQTGGDDRVGDRLAGVPLADPRVVVTVSVGAEHEPEEVDVVDPDTAPEARGMQVVEGDLSKLDHGVAITDGWSTDAGVHLGDELLGARVVAVVRDAPDLYAGVIAPASLVPAQYRDTAPELWFVDPGSVDLPALLDGTDAQVLTADAWIDETDQHTRAGNNLGLWVLLGPAGVYAAIAIVNSVLVGASQRRGQLRTIALLGATPDQLRRMALWETGLVGSAGLLVGGAVIALVGWTIRSATSADVAEQAFTLPWLPLAAIVATCAGLTLVAALVGSRQAAR